MAEKKRGRGRPKVYPDGMETLSIKVPVGLADLVKGRIAGIQLYSQRPHDPPVLALLDALKLRLRSLQNTFPDPITRDVERIDRAIAEHFPHIQR